MSINVSAYQSLRGFIYSSETCVKGRSISVLESEDKIRAEKVKVRSVSLEVSRLKGHLQAQL